MSIDITTRGFVHKIEEKTLTSGKQLFKVSINAQIRAKVEGEQYAPSLWLNADVWDELPSFIQERQLVELRGALIPREYNGKTYYDVKYAKFSVPAGRTNNTTTQTRTNTTNRTTNAEADTFFDSEGDDLNADELF